MIRGKLSAVLLTSALLSLAVSAELSSTEKNLKATQANASANHDEVTPGSMSVFESINSLDYSPREAVEGTGAQHLESASSVKSVKLEPSTKSKKSSKRRARAKQMNGSGGNTLQPIASFLVGLISQFEKMDLKSALGDSSQTQARSTVNERRSSEVKAEQGLPAAGKLAQQQQQRDGKVNMSALSAEGGQLLSITKQLVRLARNQVLGNDFGTYFSGAPMGSSWLSSAPAGSFSGSSAMLSAASQALHESLDSLSHHHSTGATLKSEWIWWLAPAVIVIGTGVIVVPLIAAWLVSQAMTQNTLTVSAGRRRRRRGIEPSDFAGPHADLFKLLDIERLIDEAPELLAEKLSHFHRALESVSANFLEQPAKLQAKLQRKSEKSI